MNSVVKIIAMLAFGSWIAGIQVLPAPTEIHAQEKGPASAGQTAAGIQRPAAYPPPYFLTPIGPSTSGTAPREMVFLFTAPLLNRERITAAAERQERSSRGILQSRQDRVAREICRMQEARAREHLARLRAEQKRQLGLWRGVQGRYERMQSDRIADLAPEFNQADLLDLQKTVRDLQAERQELVARAWREFFEDLEDDLGDCKSAASYRTLPKERLHLPVFLARYYFFRQLPPRLRIKFAS